MKRLVFRCGFASLAALLIVGAVCSAKAQGAWLPTPASGDDPYHAGTFTSNGRHYKIEYVGTYTSTSGNVAVYASFAFNASASGPFAIGASGDVNSLHFTPTSPSETDFVYLDTNTSPSGTIKGSVSTSGNNGSTIVSNLLRILRLHCAFDHPGNATCDAGPFYKFKITCTNKPNASSFGVSVIVAQGGYCQAGGSSYTTNSWSIMAAASPIPTAASVFATSPGVGNPPYIVSSGSTTKQRGGDITQQTTLYPQADGTAVGYFYVAVIPHADATIGGNSVFGGADSDYEIVPFHVIGP